MCVGTAEGQTAERQVPSYRGMFEVVRSPPRMPGGGWRTSAIHLADLAGRRGADPVRTLLRSAPVRWGMRAGPEASAEWLAMRVGRGRTKALLMRSARVRRSPSGGALALVAAGAAVAMLLVVGVWRSRRRAATVVNEDRGPDPGGPTQDTDSASRSADEVRDDAGHSADGDHLTRRDRRPISDIGRSAVREAGRGLVRAGAGLPGHVEAVRGRWRAPHRIRRLLTSRTNTAQ